MNENVINNVFAEVVEDYQILQEIHIARSNTKKTNYFIDRIALLLAQNIVLKFYELTKSKASKKDDVILNGEKFCKLYKKRVAEINNKYRTYRHKILGHTTSYVKEPPQTTLQDLKEMIDLLSAYVKNDGKYITSSYETSGVITKYLEAMLTDPTLKLR